MLLVLLPCLVCGCGFAPADARASGPQDATAAFLGELAAAGFDTASVSQGVAVARSICQSPSSRQAVAGELSAQSPSITPARAEAFVTASINHFCPAKALAPTAVVSDPRAGQEMIVRRVVDGDTVVLGALSGDGEMTARLLGIDTPETVDPSRGVACWGPEASAWASSLLTGMHVIVRGDATQDAWDRYGRALVYLTLSGGADYSVLAAQRGYAKYFLYSRPVAEAGQIQAAEQGARAAGLGLWGLPCGGNTVAASPVPALASAPVTAPAPVTQYAVADPAPRPLVADVRRAPAEAVVQAAPVVRVPAARHLTPPKAPEPEAPARSSAYYKNCAAARAAGAAPLGTGDPGYRAGLDRDGDGIACE